jgi:hypothetical protein
VVPGDAQIPAARMRTESGSPMFKMRSTRSDLPMGSGASRLPRSRNRSSLDRADNTPEDFSFDREAAARRCVSDERWVVRRGEQPAENRVCPEHTVTRLGSGRS